VSPRLVAIKAVLKSIINVRSPKSCCNLAQFSRTAAACTIQQATDEVFLGHPVVAHNPHQCHRPPPRRVQVRITVKMAPWSPKSLIRSYRYFSAQGTSRAGGSKETSPDQAPWTPSTPVCYGHRSLPLQRRRRETKRALPGHDLSQEQVDHHSSREQVGG